MKRSDLAEGARHGLSRLIAGLFDGDLLKIEAEEGQVRFLCFADREEELPELPQSDHVYGALEAGIYVSSGLYSPEDLNASGGPGDGSGRWMRVGPLDRVLDALEWAAPGQDIEAFLESYAFQRAASLAISRSSRRLELQVAAKPLAPDHSAPVRQRAA